MKSLTVLLVAAALVGQTPGVPVAIAPADAYSRLAALNNAQKFKAPLFGEVDYTGLKPENCFGVDMGAGRRFVGESGGNYGLEFIRKDQPTKTAIGLISIEGAVSVGGRAIPAGEYIVFAGPQALSFMTEPSEKSVDIPLTVAIPESRLGRKAADRPRFALTIDAGVASLIIAGNMLPVRAVPPGGAK
jgi:hypothetical protein